MHKRKLPRSTLMKWYMIFCEKCCRFAVNRCVSKRCLFENDFYINSSLFRSQDGISERWDSKSVDAHRDAFLC